MKNIIFLILFLTPNFCICQDIINKYDGSNLPGLVYNNTKNPDKSIEFDSGFGAGLFSPFNSTFINTYGGVVWQVNLNYTLWIKDFATRIDLGIAYRNKNTSKKSYYGSSSVKNVITMIPISTYVIYKLDLKKNKMYPYLGIGLDTKFVCFNNNSSINYDDSDNTDVKTIEDIGFLFGCRNKSVYIETKINPNIDNNNYHLGGLWLTVGFRF